MPEVPEPDGAVDDCGRQNSTFRRVLLTVLPLIVGVGVLIVVISSTWGIADAGHALRHMDLRWLLVAVSFEALSYLWLSFHLRMLAGARSNASRSAPLRLALVVFGLGNILPAAPAEGL